MNSQYFAISTQKHTYLCTV